MNFCRPYSLLFNYHKAPQINKAEYFLSAYPQGRNKMREAVTKVGVVPEGVVREQRRHRRAGFSSIEDKN